MSKNAKWLYVVLNELEQRFTGEKTDFFYRSNEELAIDSELSLPTLKRAKAELLQTDLVESWRAHFIYNRGTPEQKRSAQRITCYRVKQ